MNSRAVLHCQDRGRRGEALSAAFGKPVVATIFFMDPTNSKLSFNVNQTRCLYGLL